MKVKIVIQTWENEPTDSNEPFKVKYRRRQSEVWSGELDILEDNEYLAKLSVIAEGEPQPIVDIPFAMGIGHYRWIPPDYDVAEEDDGWNLADLGYETEDINDGESIRKSQGKEGKGAKLSRYMRRLIHK